MLIFFSRHWCVNPTNNYNYIRDQMLKQTKKQTIMDDILYIHIYTFENYVCRMCIQIMFAISVTRNMKAKQEKHSKVKVGFKKSTTR